MWKKLSTAYAAPYSSSMESTRGANVEEDKDYSNTFDLFVIKMETIYLKRQMNIY